jgi:hypothetical protein
VTPSNTLSNTLVGSNTPGDPPSRDNISGVHTPPPDDALGTPDYRYEIVDTGLTHDGCWDIFGHEECLVKMWRQDHRWENLAEGLTGGRP